MARKQNQRKTGQRSFDIPAIFGRGIADLALLSVAHHGPSSVAEIAARTGSHPVSIQKAVQRLANACLLVVREPNSGRQKRYILNERLYIFPYLVALLLRLQGAPHSAAQQPRPTGHSAEYLDIDRIDQRSMRLRTLLELADKSYDVRTLSQHLRRSYSSTWKAIESLECDGIVQSDYELNRRLIRLDRNFYAANELHDFLTSLLEQTGLHPKGLAAKTECE